MELRRHVWTNLFRRRRSLFTDEARRCKQYLCHTGSYHFHSTNGSNRLRRMLHPSNVISVHGIELSQNPSALRSWSIHGRARSPSRRHKQCNTSDCQRHQRPGWAVSGRPGSPDYPRCCASPSLNSSITKILTRDQQILTVLIIGERNLASAQVRYQTEPMSSIGTFRLSSPDQRDILLKPSCATSGQWAPLAGGALALSEALRFALIGKRSKNLDPVGYPPLDAISRHPSDCSSRRTEGSNSSADRIRRTPSPANLERTITRTAASAANTSTASVESHQTDIALQPLAQTHTRRSRESFNLPARSVTT
jgi:hypothetical protein